MAKSNSIREVWVKQNGECVDQTAMQWAETLWQELLYTFESVLIHFLLQKLLHLQKIDINNI